MRKKIIECGKIDFFSALCCGCVVGLCNWNYRFLEPRRRRLECVRTSLESDLVHGWNGVSMTLIIFVVQKGLVVREEISEILCNVCVRARVCFTFFFAGSIIMLSSTPLVCK